MKPLLYLGLTTTLLLGLLWATHRSAAGATVAEALYRRGILNEAGRAELQRRLQRGTLRTELHDPLTQQTQERRDNSPAAVLAFCAEAFQEAFSYRNLPLDVTSAAPASQDPQAPPTPNPQVLDFEALLRRFGGDSAAASRELYRQLPAKYHLEERIRAEDSVLAGGWTVFPPLGSQGQHHWIANTRSTLGKTRTRTARDLHALGLLDAGAFQRVLAEIHNGQLPTEADVCRRGSELMLLAGTAPERRTEQLRWLRQLRRAGLLTSRGLEQLQRQDMRYAQPAPFEVLAYCPQARVLDLRRLPRAPQHLYPALFAQLPALLPGFHPADLRIETRRRSMDATLWVDSVTLSFTANGRRYRTAFYQDFARKDGTDEPALGAKVGYEFRSGVNQWLADQDSPLRLYLATTPDAQSVYGNERLGLVALTAAQRPLWGEDTYFLTRESHDNGFSSARLEALIAEADRLGLLGHLSPAEKARGRRQALSGQVTTYAELLTSFPRVIHALDWESATPPRPYADFTARLAAISRGAFRPTEVHDGFGEDFPRTRTVPFSFRHRGQLYRKELKVQADWLDPAVADLINEAMRVPGSPGRFYECLDGEGFIFLTPPQHAYLTRTQPALFSTLDTTQIDKASLPF